MIEIQKITDAEKHLDGLKVILFDLDDTLYGEKEYVKSGYAAVAQLLPNIEHVREKLWNAFEEKKSAIDELLCSENIYSEKLKKKCLETYRLHNPNIHLYDGVADMLTRLCKRGLFLGMITDGRPEGQRLKIKVLGLEKYFKKIIITDELGGVEYRKPNSKAFEIMKAYFDVLYNQMLYVADNPNKDFIAPQKLGMKCLFFRNQNGIYLR